MKLNISFFSAGFLLVNLLTAQDISLFNQLRGHLDYTAIGNTLNTSENNSSLNCAISTDTSASLNLSSSQTIEAAYLYWAGSGSGDFNVTVNTTDITPSRTFAYSLDASRQFFAAFADVTTLIQTEGNGLYTLSNLDQIDISSAYCSTGTNFAGWAITIIYSDPALPFNQLNIYDGLESVPDSITIQLNNINVIDTTGAKVGFIAWEGDAGLAVNEVLQMNGITLSNPPLNPANNAFNGTNSFTNDSNLYNMDIDVYSIENSINVGDTSAVIKLASGQDLVMVNNIITVLNSQLADASVTIDNNEQRCIPRELTIEYTVRNLNSMRLLPANTPIAFYIDTILVAQAETLNDIPIDGTESNTLSFALDPLHLYPINLTIVVDDNGMGAGIISEINETNNSANASIVANPLPIANQPPNLEDCDDNFDGELEFDIASQTPIILGTQNPFDFTVSYYKNMADAESSNNPLNLMLTVTYTDTVVAKIVNNTTQCANYTSFNLIVNPLPIVDIPKQLICLDDLPLVVSADTSNNGDFYLWSTGQTTSEISIDTIGTYSVTVTTAKGCVNSSDFEVIESEAATIEFTEVLNFTDPNSITVIVKGIGEYRYKLDDNSLQTSNFFNYVTLGYHTITVLDLNGCSEVTKEVLVINAQKFFTPNNDTYFDTWNIVGIETLPGSVIYIFDRYGKLLVTLAYNSGGWDGTYRGSEMPATDYWFLAKIKTPTEQFDYKGHFALRR